MEVCSDTTAVRLGSGNYASILPIWDILFGTYFHPNEHHYGDLGVQGDAMPDDLWGQLLSPFTLNRI